MVRAMRTCRGGINDSLDICCGDSGDSGLYHVPEKGEAMKPGMVRIRESAETYPDGTTVTITVSTPNGEPLSPEDLAGIHRMLPLAAGSIIDTL